MQKKLTKVISYISITGIFLSFSSFASASGFQLFEQSAAQLGDFYAGAAAIAEDASTAFYNPAGLTLLPNSQLVLSGVGIFTDIAINGSSSTTNTVPLNLTYPESGNAQGGLSTLIPALFYATPLTGRLSFGFAIAPPFGLETNYSDDSFVRYSATESELETIDINPNFAYKITDNLSVGLGLDVLYADAELNAVGGVPEGAQQLYGDSTALDTNSINKGDDWGLGWNGGVLYQFSPMTRVGLSYRSSVTINLEGNSKFEGTLANQYAGGTISSNNLKTTITLPSTTILSIYQGINQQLAVMGSVTYTTWSSIKNITLQNVAGLNASLAPTTNMSANLPQHYRNTWRLAAGADYAVTSNWTLKVGTGYDQNPTNNHDRNIRLPSSNDFALSAGTHWQLAKSLGLDVGYAHLFFEQTKINNTTAFGTQTSTINAKATSSADLIGAQLTWDIG